MEFMKKVTESAKSISEGAKTIGRKSGDLVGVAKLKLEISRAEKEMENNISALGNLVYLQYKGEKGHEEEIDRLLKSVDGLEAEVTDFQQQIEKLHPKAPVCPRCQLEQPLGSKFCCMCGVSLTKENPVE